MTATTAPHHDDVHVAVTLTSAGAGSLSMGGAVRPVRGVDLDDARDRVKRVVTARAAELDRPLTMTCTDPTGEWTVQVQPDGTVTAADPAAPPDDEPEAPADDAGDDAGDAGDDAGDADDWWAADPDDDPPDDGAGVGAVIPMPRADELETPADAAGDDADWWAAGPDAAAARPRPERDGIIALDDPARPAAVAPPGGLPRPVRAPADQWTAGAPAAIGPVAPAPTAAERRARALRASLLEADTNSAPAVDGWRGSLNRHLGLRLAPGARERGARDDIAAVARHWPGPRTVAVVNGKGGAGKTPSAILLAAVLARHGGAGVVAYDNNPTRGTLGWRTRQGPHTATVVDLLPRVDHFLSPAARAAELADFVHHQSEDRYDVLRSQPETLSATAAPADDFNAVHDVLARYYRFIVVDSGNDESGPQWRAMIARADAIVVPTTTRPEHAEAARLLLDELSRADAHAAALAEAALVVVSRASRAEPDPAALTRIFRDIARDAVAIPYDPAMAGRPLILDSLAPATRRAWLTAAAALAGGLHR